MAARNSFRSPDLYIINLQSVAKPLLQILPSNRKLIYTFSINENDKSFVSEIKRLKVFTEACAFYCAYVLDT